MYGKNTVGKKIRTLLISLAILIFYFFPLYIMLNMSVRPITDLSSRLFLTKDPVFSNYVTILTDPGFWTAIKNSILNCALEILFLIPISAIGGYGLSRSNGRIANAVRSMNILIMMIPGTALLVGTYSLMAKLKLTNSIVGISLLSAGGGMTGSMFFYTVFTSSIPEDLDEAAAIDGAGVVRTFFQIIMPTMKAVTITRVIGVITGCWNNYLMPMFLLTKANKYTILLYVRKASSEAAGYNNMPMAMAASTLMVTPILIVYFLLQKHIIGGQIDSAVKG